MVKISSKQGLWKMKKLTFQEKYNVIGTQDPSFEGLFFTGVKTTGIFCRPSCRARKPREENVIFFDNAKSAIQNGFRPCKVCKPMQKLDETPAYIKDLILELHKAPFQRITDKTLTTRGLEPSHIRRWFKRHHQMTFHAYQRMIRINAAYKQIESGKSVLNSALDSGYDSLSGFNESYKSIFGETPTKEGKKEIIHITRLATALGPMFACATKHGICLLEFTDRRSLEHEFKDLRRRLNAVILPGENPHLAQLKTELGEYFQGIRKEFEVSLHTPGTDFQQAVWHSLRKIPYGTTRSYLEQAQALGNPGAVRAVGSANGKNRIAIIIPCHRVIGADGNLVGYGGGLHRKQWLLNFEKHH
jgi:AraC family transcriptional regulator of adaptative response/methylated-DNA-[protein]-cysteine methyltransferase